MLCGSTGTTLDDYYSVLYPGQTDAPHYTDGSYKKTYINYNTNKEKDYHDRAATMKEELKKTDSHLNTYLYQYLLKDGTIKFNQEMITKYTDFMGIANPIIDD